MKIILTGDIHVGRASSAVAGDRIEGHLAAAAWRRTVDLAISEKVAAVLVSGDLVEQSNQYFEARGPIEAGVRRLTEEGIRTIAVSGNHDHDVLPRIADELSQRGLDFELLGRHGTWGQTTISSPEESVRIVGWSFPQREFQSDPVSSFPSEFSDTHPTIGLLHGDLGASQSKYAPLSEATLARMPVSGWLLGHIHAPALRSPEGAPWMLYPGSPQALDPGESGVHGVWVAEVSGRTISRPKQVPISTVRYIKHVVDVSRCTDVVGIQTAISLSLRELEDSTRESGGGHLTDLVVDLELRGETPAASMMEDVLDWVKDYSTAESIQVRIRTTTDRTVPPLELGALAAGSGLAGMLARAIINLESNQQMDPEARSLMYRLMQLHQSASIQSIERQGDREERTAVDAEFLRAEAIKAARSLLASIVGAMPGEDAA